MKENKYDDIKFFNQYKEMARSKEGLSGAGEWHELKKLLPDFRGKRVLDLGCGFGWHCRYAVEQGAQSVIGIDLSENMLNQAKVLTDSKHITYRRLAIEDVDYAEDSFDVVISSLALHYVEAFDELCKKVNSCLVSGGNFIFSVEHPIFTAEGKQDWYYDSDGKPMHWPVDHYFTEGIRQSVFLGEEVTKYHRTLTTYINGLIRAGFQVTNVVEPQPEEHFLKVSEEMRNELRRPMMLLISAIKN